MKYIVLSVPHSYCLEETMRDCDERALSAAILMKECLERYNLNVFLVPNLQILRSVCDENRPQCRNTAYRKNLQNTIDNLNQNGNQVSWVLDMHSFPNVYSWSDYHPYYLVFLYLSQSQYQEDHIFRSSLKSEYVGFLEGSLLNDIMLTSQQQNIKSILIESYENNREFTDEQLRENFMIVAKLVSENN